jgi:pimeloyl-ACP methyl ester carboxylesterase
MNDMNNDSTSTPSGSTVEPRIVSGHAIASDGVELYWRAVGDGPWIACCNGVGVSTFFWKYVTAQFSDRYTVIVWDYRGHGRSQRTLDPTSTDMSVERHADDMRAVLHALAKTLELDEPRPSVVLGHSMGCQVALETRRRSPELVHGLVLMLGTAGKTLSTFFDWSHSPKIFRAAHKALFTAGPKANDFIRPLLESPLAFSFATTFSLVDPYYTRGEDFIPYLEHLATLDLRLFIENVCKTNDHDAWGLLPELDRPLLVVAAENDKFTPMWCSEKIVSDTPGAELMVLADASHAALIEQPGTINHRLERFLRERTGLSW